MVNMVGFHHKEPVYNTSSFGEEGHYFQIRWVPTDESPLRAVINFPGGRAVFQSAEHAGLFTDHPGDIPHAARFYLSELEGVA
jgi:hypothetical protein